MQSLRVGAGLCSVLHGDVSQLMLSVFKKELLKSIPVQEKLEGTGFTWPRAIKVMTCCGVLVVCVCERTQISSINYNIGKYKVFTQIKWGCVIRKKKHSLMCFFSLDSSKYLFHASILCLSYMFELQLSRNLAASTL